MSISSPVAGQPMIEIGVVTLFPSMFDAVAKYGVSSRAQRAGLWSLFCVNPRDYAEGVHRKVDDAPYGGGPGMVMMAQPLSAALSAARGKMSAEVQKDVKTVYLSPQGRPLDQNWLRRAADCRGLLLLCGRYEGIDERLIESEVDEEVSLGDFVLSGGELAAMVLIDGIVRLLPGALGNEDSTRDESFSHGMLAPPQYTRPRFFAGLEAPSELLSGNHRAICDWRHRQSLSRTCSRRPDLLGAEKEGRLPVYITHNTKNTEKS